MRTLLPRTAIAPLAALALVIGSASTAVAAVPPDTPAPSISAQPTATSTPDAVEPSVPAAPDDAATVAAPVEPVPDPGSIDPYATDTGIADGNVVDTSPQKRSNAPTAATPAATNFARPLSPKSYYISSFFGGRCIPLPGGSTMHQGIDLAARGGAPIYAVAAGRVTHTVDGTSSVAGYITIEHRVGSQIYQSRYLHMWSATTHVRVGDIVQAGQQISTVGTSGGSTGNHLHFEWWKGPWGNATVSEPSAYLKTKGVDLFADSISVTATPTPATCTYYTTTGVNFRTGPSTSASIIRLLPEGTPMTHVPGQITSGFIPVKIGTVSGWVSSSYVTPVRPAVVAPVPSTPPTYVTKGPVWMTSAPSMTATRLMLIAVPTNVGQILQTDRLWSKITYGGKTGWVYTAYLRKA